MSTRSRRNGLATKFQECGRKIFRTISPKSGRVQGVLKFMEGLRPFDLEIRTPDSGPSLPSGGRQEDSTITYSADCECALWFFL